MINSILEFVGSEKEKLKGVQLVYFFQIGLFSSFFFFVIFTFSFQCAFFRGLFIVCFSWNLSIPQFLVLCGKLYVLKVQILVGKYFCSQYKLKLEIIFGFLSLIDIDL
eukprot:TRINITY_DN7424_c0_g1_i11.p4 TRINITY_DN7424_c0_g1~~TRINITY_DN7424_c0_g1_i11.p4  ORF type:complete len:108 (-),score=1.16 TRINITY_DN7424_c0_g1_i11:212-535(-)